MINAWILLLISNWLTIAFLVYTCYFLIKQNQNLREEFTKERGDLLNRILARNFKEYQEYKEDSNEEDSKFKGSHRTDEWEAMIQQGYSKEQIESMLKSMSEYR